jgi:hypothetical protein
VKAAGKMHEAEEESHRNFTLISAVQRRESYRIHLKDETASEASRLKSSIKRDQRRINLRIWEFTQEFRENHLWI